MDSKQLLATVVRAADGKRAEQIVALDVQNVSLLADYFVIMQGNLSGRLRPSLIVLTKP